MYVPPIDPRDDPLTTRPALRGILVIYAALVAFPVLLWIVSQPMAGTVVLVTVIGSAIGVRRAARLARCFYDCGGFVFDLGGRIRISITRPEPDCVC